MSTTLLRGVGALWRPRRWKYKREESRVEDRWHYMITGEQPRRCRHCGKPAYKWLTLRQRYAMEADALD